MFITSASRSRSPNHSTRPRRCTGAPAESLEGRLLFTFNAYISGLGSGVVHQQSSYTLSTTGQAAKSWLVHWGDQKPDTPLNAPDPIGGFTTPQTVFHTYDDLGPHAVTADATSITNVTVTAVPLSLNSAWTGEGTNGVGGKTVDGLRDNASVGTNIATALDQDKRTYVLSIDGLRMAVSRSP